MIGALADEVGRERVLAVVRRVVVAIAREQGQELRAHAGAGDLRAFAATKEPWTRGGALEIEVLRETDREYHFDVTRCRYAEMYRALGIPELGVLLSCGRDFALGEGFSPRLRLARTQTIMEGAPRCDFRYTLDETPPPTGPGGNAP